MPQSSNDTALLLHHSAAFLKSQAPKQLSNLHCTIMQSVPVQPQAYEEQLGQARAIQAQLQLCEEELEARTQDLTRYAAENRNLQV